MQYVIIETFCIFLFISGTILRGPFTYELKYFETVCKAHASWRVRCITVYIPHLHLWKRVYILKHMILQFQNIE